MKNLKIPLLLSFMLTILVTLTLSAQSTKDLTLGGTEYRMPAEQVHAIKMENLNQVHQELSQDARRAELVYIPSDYSPNYAIPLTALLPSRPRNGYSGYNGVIDVRIAPSTYPGTQLNYYNRANNQKPLFVPFIMARTNP